MSEDNWISIKDRLPKEGEVVDTKIDNANGVRNEQELKRIGSLWLFPDENMYVYYAPTHWQPLQNPPEKIQSQ